MEAIAAEFPDFRVNKNGSCLSKRYISKALANCTHVDRCGAYNTMRALANPYASHPCHRDPSGSFNLCVVSSLVSSELTELTFVRISCLSDNCKFMSVVNCVVRSQNLGATT